MHIVRHTPAYFDVPRDTKPPNNSHMAYKRASKIAAWQRAWPSPPDSLYPLQGSNLPKPWKSLPINKEERARNGHKERDVYYQRERRSLDMRTRLRGKFPLLFIALAVLLAIPAIALADNVVNNVSVTPSTGGQKQLTVEAGKTSTAVAYRINATGGDTTDTTGPTGQNCNPVVTPAQLTISGLPAGVSVKDSTGTTTLTAPHLTFTTCGVDQSVKFAVANNTTPGNYAITVADITNNGYTSGDFAEANGTFNLVVTADVTSPDTVIDTGPSGTVTSDSATFTFHSTEANSTFETRLDNGTWLANGTATSKTYNSLSNAPHTFDVRATDPSGNVDASPATQTWTVNTVPPNSAPQVSVTGVTNNGSYEIGSEPTPDCSVVDAEDTGESADPVVDRSALNSFGLGTVTVTCSYEDTGGLDDSDTVSYTVVDTNGPSSFHQLSAEANGNGWHNANVTVTLTGTDSTPGSGLKEIRYSTDGGASYSVYNSASKPVISTEGTTTFSYHAVDNANNSETDNSFTIKLDKTDPTITASRTAGPNANGWNNSDVTVEFSCDDNLSGVNASDCSDDAVLGEGANQSATGTATDRAGNTASVTENDINVDKTDPTITATRTPGPNANGWNKTDVAVDFACNDNLSGVDGSCGPDQTLENEGANQSATGNVTDRAGNTASLTENVNIDKTAPVVTPGTVSGTKGLGSWYTSAVTQAFNANDVLSGIDGANSDSQTSTTEGAGVQLTSRTFSDKAGNTATGSATFDIDLSNPLLRITGAASGTTYTACGAAPTRPT